MDCGRLPDNCYTIDVLTRAQDLPYFQDDRLKKDWHGNIVQTRVKELLDQVRASIK
jgi:hypothetical protein